jgi:predicted acetyltransferase
VSPATPRAGRPPALRYRPARRTDVEALAELGARAYRVASIEKRREFYTDHPRFGLRDVRVGELDGAIVASLVLYPFEAWVRGRKLPIAGIGSVAVSPEHRRRGVADALLRATLRELRVSSRPLSMLAPFRDAFYRRFGWGTCEIVHQFAFAPANLATFDEARYVRRLAPPDREKVQALYAEIAAGSGHFALARNEAWWTRRLWTYPGDWVVYERRRGAIEGYAYYEMDNTKGYHHLAMSLREFVAATPEAHRGLVSHVASLADQVEEVQLAAPANHGWAWLLKSAQNLHPGSEIDAYRDTGNLGLGCQLRLVDVKAALELLPVVPGTRGSLRLEVEDPVLPPNARAWQLTGDGSAHLKVGPAAAASGRRARLGVRAGVEPLASIVAGALPAKTAMRAGLIDATPEAAALLDAWYRGTPGYLFPMNAF